MNNRLVTKDTPEVQTFFEELENLLSKCEAVKECIVREKGKKICAVIYCGEADQQLSLIHI